MKEILFNSKKVLSQSRYPWVDYARGIAIILICFRHSFEGLAAVGDGSDSYSGLRYFDVSLFTVRMHLFFIISGMFFGATVARNSMQDIVRKRFQNIFYPLLIWGSIQITLQLIFSKYVNADRSPIDYLNLLINPKEIEQFWYLNTLFFVGIIYAYLRLYAKFKAIHQLALGVIFFMMAFFIVKAGLKVGFIFEILFYYLYFALGDVTAGFFMNTKNYKLLSSPLTLAVILPVHIVTQHYCFTRLNIGHNWDYYVQYTQPWLYVIASLTGSALIINICFILEKLNVFRFLRVIGFHSLYIYVMHLMITSATRSIFTRLLGVTNVPLILIMSIVLGVALPIIIYNLSMRFGMWGLYTPNKPVGAGKVPGKRWNYLLTMVGQRKGVGNS